MEHLHYAGSIKSFMRLIPIAEYRMWLARIDELWEQPDRHDHYLMAIRADIASMFGSAPNFDKLKVRFSSPTDTPRDPTIKSKTYVEQRIAEAKANAGIVVRGKRPNS